MALQRLKESRSNCGSLLMTLENVQDAGWETSWKQYYKPLEIGERLLVVPQWETVDPHDRVTVTLDPGLTFGTGNHATTRLCLTALEKAVRGGERVLDLGCGSGILSIAALRLGARDNAALNRIGEDNFTVRTGNVLTDGDFRTSLGGEYDIVLANIVADVIIGLAPLVRSFMRKGGVFLCSGIIDSRTEEVAGQLRRAGLTVLERREADGWTAFACN